MNKISCFILIAIIIVAFSGCKEDHNTSHPDEGGIILTMDWSEVEGAIPSTYHANIISSSGKNSSFNHLNGTTNNLVVEPGGAVIYVYNEAERISVTEKKIMVANVGTGIAADPGLFFSYAGDIYTERDRDIEKTALMTRQTGELKLSIALKPASVIDKIKTIRAVLDGVASELDMQTNELATPASTSVTFSKSAYYATATIRTLGFVPATNQQLHLEVEFENGNTASVTNDLTSALNGFNASKNGLFSLNTSIVADENTSSATVGNWERNIESRYLSVYPQEISFPYTASVEFVNIATDQESWGYSVVNAGDWLVASKDGAQLKLSAAQNTNEAARQATIHISAGGVNESITITQSGHENEYYSDMEVVKLQSATVGNGVNIILMGDGYTSKEMAKGIGKYEVDMRAATEHFFLLNPYSIYRDHFNVYMIAAISNEEGISDILENRYVDTKFESLWEGEGSTTINCNGDRVIEYVYSITSLTDIHLNDLTVIMPINAYIYAGTCMMAFYTSDGLTNFGNGFSISMCPVGEYFKEVVIHEAAGHGFSKVTDEYIYYPTRTIPDEDKEETLFFKTLGWCENVDFYSDIAQTTWSGFANNPKYSMVGTFEGAQMYGKGIWRPEYDSCMNRNILYFNAPTRWAQVRRIKKLAGIDYSFSQFLLDDIVPEFPTETRSMKNLKPLAPPVMKMIQ